MTVLEDLQTRRTAVAAELAAMTSSSNGGKPTYSKEGQSVDHVGYKRSLYEELKMLDEQIANADRLIEVSEFHRTI